jgi:hypothetical protein
LLLRWKSDMRSSVGIGIQSRGEAVVIGARARSRPGLNRPLRLLPSVSVR